MPSVNTKPSWRMPAEERQFWMDVYKIQLAAGGPFVLAEQAADSALAALRRADEDDRKRREERTP